MDVIGAVQLLMFAGVVALVLLVLNPFFNKGGLFYVQKRMGKDCKPFKAIKFRSMTDGDDLDRGAECPLEVDRITPLGKFLRKTRLDEFPQAWNVLKGEMSLIGPRPDNYDHACHYLKEVPGYRERHSVRPGISGLAQIKIGYVAGSEATKAKVAADLEYIRNLGFRQEASLFVQSCTTILRGAGA